jgi:hypothetical protein
MADFSDVIQFVRTHRPCGGVTPAVRPEPPGGYLLTLTCGCGAVLDRQVTADEAPHVPFANAAPAAPPAAQAPRPSSARPRPTPSPELERAMQEALAAEEKAPAAVEPPPEREPPRTALSQALEDVLREALAAEEAAAAAPPPRASASAAVPAPKRSVAPLPVANVQETVKAALREQERRRGALTPSAAHARPRSRARWLGVAILVVMVAGGAAFYVAETLEPDAPAGTPSSTAMPAAAPSEAPTYGNAVIELRRLQAASIPTTSLPAYEARVNAALAILGRYMEGEAPSDAKRSLRSILDLHLLAITAWRVRAIDTPQAWEPVSRSATLELCESVENAAYIAERPGLNTAQTRGRAIAASIPLLWECAARRLAKL